MPAVGLATPQARDEAFLDGISGERFNRCGGENPRLRSLSGVE